jgi:hypothetical protein
MLCRLLVLLVAALVFVGCDQTSSPTERQEREGGVELVREEVEEASLPDYDVMMDQDCSGDFPQKCLNVATDATSEEAFTKLTRYFKEENPEYLAVLVTFYEARQTPEQTGSGFAFRSEEAARSVLSSMYTNPAEASIDEQVRETMENDGLYVISFADEVEDMNREVCAEWDVTTMGTPPPEMNCPGY